MPSVSQQLFVELEELNAQQQHAALAKGNVVVRAGPGSGKTRTLVARAGVLLEEDITRFRGAACITYTNAAASEVRHRLRRLGVRSEGRLTCSTLHSFCLNGILRAFAPLTGEWLPASGQVLDDIAGVDLLQQCFDELSIADLVAKYRSPTITKIRRALACDEAVDGFDVREVRAAHMYERKLTELQFIDFEAMVIRSLRIVREHASVRDLLRAKYPHVIVDEYQDLGGVLHQLILTLRDQAGISVSAVGDADQSIYGFTGADPKYLDELAAREDFCSIELEVNYRSGQTIIRAAEAALGRSGRVRRAADGLTDGNISILPIDGSLDEHANESYSLVEQRQSGGVPLEKIAILYPQRGPILDAVLQRFDRSDIPVFHERAERLPGGSLSKFVQRCASTTVAYSQAHRRGKAYGNPISAAVAPSDAPDLFTLERELVVLRAEASLPPPTQRLTLLRSLQRVLDPREPWDSSHEALTWLHQLTDALDLNAIAEDHPDTNNANALRLLNAACRSKKLALEDVAAQVEVAGKVLLTTYHSAKGREFETVILPGLVNGLVPRDVMINGRWQKSDGAGLAEQRRGFYVAVTRPQEHLYCLIGQGYYTTRGYWIEKGPSDFVVEMQSRLGEHGKPKSNEDHDD